VKKNVKRWRKDGIAKKYKQGRGGIEVKEIYEAPSLHILFSLEYNYSVKKCRDEARGIDDHHGKFTVGQPEPPEDASSSKNFM